jgi:hypothetical protein
VTPIFFTSKDSLQPEHENPFSMLSRKIMRSQSRPDASEFSPHSLLAIPLNKFFTMAGTTSPDDMVIDALFGECGHSEREKHFKNR